MSVILIDTNVLVYAHDRDEHRKQGPAIFSQDFATNRVAEGVRFVNPFGPDFSLEAVGLPKFSKRNPKFRKQRISGEIYTTIGSLPLEDRV